MGIWVSGKPGVTTVTIGYSISLSEWTGLPSGATITGWSGNIGGMQVQNSQTYSGFQDFKNLQEGLYNTITANVKCHYSYIVTETKVEIDSNGNTTITEVQVPKTGETEIKNYSVGFYTHPGACHMGAVKYDPNNNQIGENTIISKVLNSDKINTWISYFNKAYHWYIQSGDNYPNLTSLYIPKNKIISHEWYNNCITALNSIREDQYHFPTVRKDDIITAEIINRLNINGP